MLRGGEYLSKQTNLTTSVVLVQYFSYLPLQVFALFLSARPGATSVYHPILSNLPSDHLLFHIALHLSASCQKYVHVDRDDPAEGSQSLLPWGRFYQSGVGYLLEFCLGEGQDVETIAAVHVAV
jgi:hypothetical protein